MTTITEAFAAQTGAAPVQGEKRKRAAPAKKATGTGEGVKRAIVLPDGKEVELNTINAESVKARPAIIEVLKARIIELEDQLSSQAPPAKRARKATGTGDDGNNAEAGPSGSNATASGTASKAEEKKIKAQLKKIFDRLKKECKSDNCKFQGDPKTIKLDEVLEPSEFEAIFGGKGLLIQPTPNNKPKSTVTIIGFRNSAQIDALFGPDLIKQLPLKGNRWSRGGVPTRTFGGGFGFGFGSSTFSKSSKIGPCDVEVRSLDVNYSKNGMKCTLKFEVGEVGGGYGGYGDYDYF